MFSGAHSFVVLPLSRYFFLSRKLDNLNNSTFSLDLPLDVTLHASSLRELVGSFNVLLFALTWSEQLIFVPLQDTSSLSKEFNVGGVGGSSWISLLHLGNSTFFLMRFSYFSTYSDANIRIGVKRSLSFKMVLPMALILARSVDALIEASWIWSGTTHFSRKSPIPDSLTSKTVDWTFLCCFLTAQIFFSSITLFLAIYATQESLLNSDSMMPCSNIVLASDKWTHR